jgi:hypothetical protein
MHNPAQRQPAQHSAVQRLAALDDLATPELCNRAQVTLDSLARVMNEETTLLRAGHFREAGRLTADKASIAQDYVGIARAVQRQAERLRSESPSGFALLVAGQERLATQIAENLKVIATMRRVTDDLLTDVSEAVGRKARATTYGANARMGTTPSGAARGIAINRAL